MDGVEAPPGAGVQPLQGVRLVELKWVVLLGYMVNAHHLKAGLAVAHTGAASPAKQVSDAEFHAATLSLATDFSKSTILSAAPWWYFS